MGRYDNRPPNRPRSKTMAGCPVCAPGTVDNDSMNVPRIVPTTTAVNAATSDNGATPAGANT